MATPKRKIIKSSSLILDDMFKLFYARMSGMTIEQIAEKFKRPIKDVQYFFELSFMPFYKAPKWWRIEREIIRRLADQEMKPPEIAEKLLRPAHEILGAMLQINRYECDDTTWEAERQEMEIADLRASIMRCFCVCDELKYCKESTGIDESELMKLIEELCIEKLLEKKSDEHYKPIRWYKQHFRHIHEQISVSDICDGIANQRKYAAIID